MPRRNDIAKILILGSGPIVIGQSAEFDYSGAQACKALKSEGYEVVLVNSNPATIMTDPEMADRTYIEPLNRTYLEEIIRVEAEMLAASGRPGIFAVLPTVGGQTALNLAVELADSGVLEKYGAQLIGAQLDAIKKGEDRLLFKDAMTKIGLEVPKSSLVNNLRDGLDFSSKIGFPVILRPSFTLGGTGGGIAYNREELLELLARGLDLSPVHEVLLEESVLGWKEYELELMRDLADNVIVICSIENFDPMGVHTGDSITVAPAQTLTDREYQAMRDAAIAVIREIGVETGGSNIQFAVDPHNGRMVVIEMNPRVSRSSALASKATGFPIAKIAAKLAVGYTLDEITNDITRKTPACFEPTLDYVVVKIPKWQFEKFHGADESLGPQMKSVGEVMAIGRTFKQALLKAVRSLETGKRIGSEKIEPRILTKRLVTPHPERLQYIRYALSQGMTVREIAQMTNIDPWFLHQLKEIADEQAKLHEALPLESISTDQLAPSQARRILRRASGQFAPDQRRQSLLRENSSATQATRRSPGVQARGHLRRRVRKLHALHVLDLRGRRRGHAHRPQEGHHPGQRPQPHRAGNRVRLLLLPCCIRTARRRLRDDHGQLQSRDRLHRLRHQRSPLLRAAHLRRRDGSVRARGRRRSPRRRHRAVWRTDSAEPRLAPERRRRADHRNLAREHRSRRRPQALRQVARGARYSAASRSHCRQRRRGARQRQPHSATPCWCGLPTCSADAPWSLPTTTSPSIAT